MNLNEYQAKAYATALPKAKTLAYMILGIAGEAGEVAGKMKKYIRGDKDYEKLREELKAEIGDVLWYAAGAAQQLNLSLEDIAKANIEKLHDRQLRGKLQGDGDKR